MESNELRIGNLFYYGPTVANVVGLMPDGILYEYIGIEPRIGKVMYGGVKGIPITEEWLLKFGYVHNEEWDIFHLSDYNIDDIHMQNKSNLVFRFYNHTNNRKCYQFYLDSMSSPQWSPRLHFINDIKYVHQLQNLYFALTGKELELQNT